jgi:hypothetical protein
MEGGSSAALVLFQCFHLSYKPLSFEQSGGVALVAGNLRAGDQGQQLRAFGSDCPFYSLLLVKCAAQSPPCILYLATSRHPC